MRFVLIAALVAMLAGCSSASKPPEPSGAWTPVNHQPAQGT
ncbi:hypothetical protein [Burkholderia territorii]|nr:hypothetical protein [Burkholderia territorii]